MQQSEGTADETHGCASSTPAISAHVAVCDACDCIVPGTHVITEDAMTAPTTHSATAADARFRIKSIVNRSCSRTSTHSSWSGRAGMAEMGTLARAATAPQNNRLVQIRL